MIYIFQHSVFIFRIRYYSQFRQTIRKFLLSVMGMKIGKGTVLPQIHITWPHQVSIGNNCNLEYGIYFKFDGIWGLGPNIKIGNNVFIGANCEFNIRAAINIGSDTLIASGCKFIDHDHGTRLHSLMRVQSGPEKKISIGSNVWLGFNVIILKGVKIGNGSIVAANAVVTKNIGVNEIWAGIPAKKIGERR